ncbi:helix-turn-helix domain-containing protein [Vallitalea guaymasensis]|uniref:helix-turn-helix domain-containing protein n=1 Tax=Vallitalea guaymasensis TaxID=1185412 RepID=UPI000DE36200|nr:AraC family transcriptional regulator [Vallitalea guaymasensis]
MNESLLADVKVNLRIMSYTKVSPTWGEVISKQEFNRFYFICDGEGFVEIDGKKYFPTGGDLILLPAGKKVSFGTINDNTYLKYWCHFDAKIGDSNLFDYVQLPYVVAVQDYHHVIKLYKKLLGYYDHADLPALFMIKSLLIELIALYIREANKDSDCDVPTLCFNEKISFILHYIEKNISRPLSNQILAEKLNFHPGHFIRFFKASLGISPMKYILRLRMKQAEFLLLSSYLSISEIGERVGYANVYHFSKAFKQYVGYSPSEYRQHFNNTDLLNSDV